MDESAKPQEGRGGAPFAAFLTHPGFPVPRYHFLGKGAGDAAQPLAAFDRALLAAGVGDVNLVRLSSILPPGCRRIDPFRIPYGALVPVIYSAITSDQPGRVIAAAVAMAFPEDPALPGLAMEFSGQVTGEEAEARVREMAAANMEYRGREALRIETLVSEHTVQACGCAFAGIVLVP